jgi:hypothetical protein
VCPDDWEPRHEQDFTRSTEDRIAAQGFVRLDPEPTFVDIEYVGPPPVDPPDPPIDPPEPDGILYSAEHVVDSNGEVTISCYSQLSEDTLFAAVRTSGPYDDSSRNDIITGYDALWDDEVTPVVGKNSWTLTGLPAGITIYSGFVQSL